MDSGRGGNGGVGNVVTKASRNEAAWAAVRADESDVAGGVRGWGCTRGFIPYGFI